MWHLGFFFFFFLGRIVNRGQVKVVVRQEMVLRSKVRVRARERSGARSSRHICETTMSANVVFRQIDRQKDR